MADSQYLHSMKRETLRAFFESSSTVRLLRSDFAPYIIDFLNRTFKSNEVISLGMADLRTKLSLYQEDLHEQQSDILIGPPERYLTQWVEAGWLQRFLESTALEPQFQLTRFAEEAIRFVDESLSRGNGLVGTESRLRLVIETLEDIVRGASADPQRRLEYLRLQRDEINAEIESIENGKSVKIYRPVQIRERFQAAINLLKELQSDFRAVEERFQFIARDVQQRQTAGNETRGGILAYALDAEDMLKMQDEGISFFAFVTFLFNPSQQESLMKNIREIQRMEALSDQTESLYRVRRMMPALKAEADKVLKTTARLTTTLKRLLDSRANAERVRLANVLKDIRQAALKLAANSATPKAQKEFYDVMSMVVETDAEISSPMARTFWTPTQSFLSEVAEENPIDLEQAKRIAAAYSKLQRLDLRALRAQIRDVTREYGNITLGKLLDLQHENKGVVELLAMLQIAHDDGHPIDSSLEEVVELQETGRKSTLLRITIPHVTYLAVNANREIKRKPR